MNLYTLIVAWLCGVVGFSAHATPLGRTVYGVFESVDGNPAICLPSDAKRSFSVGWAVISESYAQKGGFWGVALKLNASPLVLRSGECFVYGAVPEEYELEGLGLNERALKFEENRTYVFRITESSGTNDTYRVVFCAGENHGGGFKYFEYTHLPDGVTITPFCDAKKNRRTPE
ncbi:hypothetical protein [Pseudomonas laurylsulfativorans]|uniref:hypothetical protein n=1 Tax=Pseudomonas laurylsulfativorans TaxID=1943631 RepID=UPI0010572F11|nr:hypothetical protein [Pseudomonas laurylsulfativorans]